MKLITFLLTFALLLTLSQAQRGGGGGSRSSSRSSRSSSRSFGSSSWSSSNKNGTTGGKNSTSSGGLGILSLFFAGFGGLAYFANKNEKKKLAERKVKIEKLFD